MWEGCIPWWDTCRDSLEPMAIFALGKEAFAVMAFVVEGIAEEVLFEAVLSFF